MKRAFTSIVILSAVILAFYWFVGPDKLGREELLSADILKSLRGKVYSSPIDSSPFEYFFIDEDGNLYGIEPELNDTIENTEIIEKIKELENSNKQVEIKGKIEKEVEDYGDKRIKVKEIQEIKEESSQKESFSLQESITCKDQGGKITTKTICSFSNGQECDLENLLKGRCP